MVVASTTSATITARVKQFRFDRRDLFLIIDSLYGELVLVTHPFDLPYTIVAMLLIWEGQVGVSGSEAETRWKRASKLLPA